MELAGNGSAHTESDNTESHGRSGYAPIVEDSDVPTPVGIVKPDSMPKRCWDMLIMLLILYSAVVVPMRICFDVEATGTMWFFEAGMSIFFLCDLVLSFNTAFYSEGRWVTSRLSIARSYLQGWFWIDAPSSVPVEIIELFFASGDAGSFAAFRVLRLMRLVRMLRMLKISEYMSRLEEQLDINLRAVKVLQLIVMMMFMAHLLACGWFFMTTLAPEGVPTWIDIFDDGSAAEGPFEEQYLFSFYWALTALVGEGADTAKAQTDYEKGYSIFVRVLRSLFFAYVVGEISTLLQALDRQAALVDEKMDTVKEYLRWRGISRDLNIRIRRYYEHFYKTQAVFDEKAILDGLNPALHKEIVKEICEETVGKLPLFAKMSDEFKTSIFPLLKPLSVSAGELVFRKGAVANELLFLLDGEVDVLSETDGATPVRRILNDHELLLGNGSEIKVDGVGGCFGQSVLYGRRRANSHVAREICEMLIIERKDLLALFKARPVDARRLCTIVLENYEKQEKLRSLRLRMLRGLVTDPVMLAALRIQCGWRRFQDEETRQNDALSKYIAESVPQRRVPTARWQDAGAHISKTLSSLAKLAPPGSPSAAAGAAVGSDAAAGLGAPLANGSVMLGQLSALDAKLTARLDLLTELVKQAVQQDRRPAGAQSGPDGAPSGPDGMPSGPDGAQRGSSVAVHGDASADVAPARLIAPSKAKSKPESSRTGTGTGTGTGAGAGPGPSTKGTSAVVATTRGAAALGSGGALAATSPSRVEAPNVACHAGTIAAARLERASQRGSRPTPDAPPASNRPANRPAAAVWCDAAGRYRQPAASHRPSS